jgi:hypothetical protein
MQPHLSRFEKTKRKAEKKENEENKTQPFLNGLVFVERNRDLRKT